MNDDRTQIETKDRELVITRIFDAPRGLVFEAFSTCEHLSNWWGPREWPIAACEMDFREGGRWNYCMKGPNGELACGLALYRMIRKPEKIIYEDRFTDETGKVNEEMPASLVTFEFFEHGDKTRMIGTAEYSTPGELKTVLDMGMVSGMTETLDRLEEHLAAIPRTVKT